MSYVIQNFYNPDKRIILNYRIKYYLIFNNWNIILFFFKTYFINFYHNNWSPALVYHASKIQTTKFNNWFNFFYKNSFYLPNFYPNNLYLSILYWNFKTLLSFSYTSSQHPFQFFHFSCLPFSAIYWKPIKTVYFELNKNFYDKIIMFLFYYNQVIWYNFDKNFNIKFSFLIVYPLFRLNVFYNNFFFPIYNF